MTTRRSIKKLKELIDRQDIYACFREDYVTNAQVNASMEEIRIEAEKLQQDVTDEETQKKVADLIQHCNEAMYSHKIYVEQEQLVILQAYDTTRKFVVISTSFGVGHNRIIACEYDDAIQNGKAVLNNDYLLAIRVSRQTYHEAYQHIDQVRRNSGESTLLYGHKEASTTWVDY
ncbi:MAG: hypothetical protein ACRD8Z_18155 [Nitrososphaeraceae archaeon]